jgi:SAP domain-containing ribonucleoprotein
MADYAKKKNDELAALCKERGLPHTGKKAELVKRLEDYDASQPSTAPAAVKPVAEDEIDWDDEPAMEAARSATTQPAADAIAAGGIGVEVPNPQAIPNQVVAEDPAQSNDLSVAAVGEPSEIKPAGEEAEKPEEKDFSQGLVDRTIDEEIEKRKARARKFGMPEDTDDIKALERAKRFGTADLPGLLNKALPSERKRGRDGGDGDGGIRKRSRGPQRGGRHGRGPRREKERTPVATGGSGGGSYPSWMTSEDRAKAEARKAKFGSAAS